MVLSRRIQVWRYTGDGCCSHMVLTLHWLTALLNWLAAHRRRHLVDTSVILLQDFRLCFSNKTLKRICLHELFIIKHCISLCGKYTGFWPTSCGTFLAKNVVFDGRIWTGNSTSNPAYSHMHKADGNAIMHCGVTAVLSNVCKNSFVALVNL